MGVESANYQIRYDGSLEQELERAVGVLGADVVSSSGRATEGVVQNEDLGARSWSGIVESFERRRAAFRDRFGDYTAAISADDVFARLRDRQASD